MSTGAHDPDSPISTADEHQHDHHHDHDHGDEEGHGEEGEASKPKLDLEVDIREVGPCKKHVVVAIPRSEVDRQFSESLGTMKRDAQVPGFRPGRAPRSLIEKRFRKQVSEQVKSTLLMAALEQLDADYKLNPISQPKLDVEAIAIPDEGPIRFEIEIEVRPDFPLPTYKALTVNRPVKELTDADVDTQLKLFLERHAQLVPKLEGGAEIGDYLTTDLTFHRDGKVYNEAKEIQFRLQPELRFQDGSVPGVGEVLRGIKPGETRDAEARIGTGSSDPELRGGTIQVTFTVHDLKQIRLPEVDKAFLEKIGFESEVELREALREILERRLKSQQRQAMRREVMDKLIAETKFDLPADLVSRQEKATVRRLVMQMQQEGLNESEIRAREAEIRANAHESTLLSLKEFFILEKIAEEEQIEVKEEDFDEEIEAIAAKSDESVRRVRSRIEKDNLVDALASQILERKTLDRIFDYVSYTEVPLVESDVAIETLDQTASPARAETETEAEDPAPASPAESGEPAQASSGGPAD